MSTNEIFYLVYISQILLISFIMPSWVVKRFNKMTIEYPPTTHPKLYPVSISTLKSSLRTFRILNTLAILIGGYILGYTLFAGAKELLNWDTQSMLTLTFLMQVVPFFYLSITGFKYQQLMRKTNPSTKRKATLTPRRMFNFIPMHLMVWVGVTFIVYVLMVIYAAKNPFPGFAGYKNILFVFLLNTFYLFMAHRIISAKKVDPHQSNEDRVILNLLICKILILGAIFCNLFLTINMALSVLDLRHIGDIIQSLYFQLVALMMSQTTTHEPTDYSVYQSESKTAEISS